MLCVPSLKKFFMGEHSWGGRRGGDRRVAFRRKGAGSGATHTCKFSSPFLCRLVSFRSHTSPETSVEGLGGRVWKRRAFMHWGSCPSHVETDICSLPNSCRQLDPLWRLKLYRLMAKLLLNPLPTSRSFRVCMPTALHLAHARRFEVFFRICLSFLSPRPSPNPRVHAHIKSHPG